MKSRYLLMGCFVCAACFVKAQQNPGTKDTLISNNGIRLGNKTVTSISVDSSGASKSNYKLITEAAAKKYTDMKTGVAVLNSVKEIATFNSPFVNCLFINDTLQGGVFFRYAGNDKPDNGMIFSDAAAVKWLRNTSAPIINIHWYGAKTLERGIPDNQQDCYDKFTAAINYIYQHYSRFQVLYLPHEDRSYGNGLYYCSKTLVLDKSINITGDMGVDRPASSIRWPANTRCFYFPSTNTADITMENLSLSQDFLKAGLDKTAHVIDTRCVIHLKNIRIDFGAGNGINIEACASPSSPIRGNADRSDLKNCQVISCSTGFFLNGCDANIIMFDNCSAVSNRAWGVYDNSELGNYYYGFHFSNNGKNPANMVTYNGIAYLAADELINRNKRPDLYPAYWIGIQDTDGAGYAEPWKADKEYFSGGTVHATGASQNTQFIQCYVESFSPPVFLGDRSSWMGGIQGARIIGGVNIHQYNAVYNFLNGNVSVANKLGVGMQPGIEQLNVNAADYQVAKFSTASANMELRFANKTDGYGFIAYTDSSIGFGTRAISRIKLNDRLFAPFADSYIDLGANNMKWKNLYAVNGNFAEGSFITSLKVPVVNKTDNSNNAASTAWVKKQLTENLNLGNLADYPGNKAAMAAGLRPGDVYRNGDVLMVVH